MFSLGKMLLKIAYVSWNIHIISKMFHAYLVWNMYVHYGSISYLSVLFRKKRKIRNKRKMIRLFLMKGNNWKWRTPRRWRRLKTHCHLSAGPSWSARGSKWTSCWLRTRFPSFTMTTPSSSARMTKVISFFHSVVVWAWNPFVEYGRANISKWNKVLRFPSVSIT